MANQASPPNPKYSAPALVKGLDILEILSSEPYGMTLTQLAESLGRSMNEIFRMVNYLHHRGYLERSDPGGVYRLSLRLFELAHRFPPTARLLEVSVPAMRLLADSVQESCHLSVLHRNEILVIGQIESPAKWQFSVRVGATFSVAETASGRVILAFSGPETYRQLAQFSEASASSEATEAALQRRLSRIRKQGYEQISNETLQGVADISCPIHGHGNQTLAALTVPVLLSHRKQDSLDRVREALLATTREISHQLGAASSGSVCGEK